MRNYKADLLAFLFVGLVAVAAFMSNSCRKSAPSDKPAPAEVQRIDIMNSDSLKAEQYRAEAEKWETRFKDAQRALTTAQGNDKKETEKAQYSAALYVKTPSLVNCNTALVDCQSENKAKAAEIALHEKLLLMADSLHRLDQSEIGRLDLVKDSLNLGWKKANAELKKAGKRRPFGFGVMAGYGVAKSGLSPFVGVGVSYTLVRF